jgi:hypothetical protein
MFKTAALTAIASLCLCATAVLRAAGESKSSPNAGGSGRFFEMRTYTAAPGKLDALNARFREHTNRLFEKHGITIIGFWTPVEGDKAQNTLVYILAYPSKEAREKSWKEFQGDPDWQAARKESERDGKLVDHVESVFLRATDYSPIK